MDISQIDFQQLRVKHIYFKTKVRALLYGVGFDEQFFSDKSPLSVWFDTTGKQRYAGSPEIIQLARLHQELIFSARALHRQYSNGEIEQAHEAFKSINQQSERFLSILDQMEQRLTLT
ncbi:hypothetical protein ABID22_000777 [Pontibacter aydingkolensis]|uniref:Histidine kinase n=1 Tax=Pontibacter aydingkolensis TaxID=1911536 RepID=A0ABS7CR94_9BACT|nr:histidine kinase [Pontibacter aydingkolensis]MBW7466353.1 histidine kinase [Pontibacter aydingkolensis]